MRFFELLTRHSLPFLEFLFFTLLLLPNVFVFVLPLGFFISVFSVYYRMFCRQEIVVLQNFGVSLKDFARPVWIGGSLWITLALILTIFIIPLSVQTLKNAENLLRSQVKISSLAPNHFHNIQDITLRIGSKNSPRRWRNLFIQDQRDPQHITTLVAKDALITLHTSEDISLDLSQGMLVKIPRGKEGSPSSVNFAAYRVRFSLPPPPKRGFYAAEQSTRHLISPPSPLTPRQKRLCRQELKSRILSPLYTLSCGAWALLALFFLTSIPQRFLRGCTVFVATSLMQGLLILGLRPHGAHDWISWGVYALIFIPLALWITRS